MATDDLPGVEANVNARNRKANGARIRNLTPEDARQLYDQVCANIRTSDDISFKLLGFVPLVSGAGITVVLSTDTTLSDLPLVLFVGLFGAVVTFALYRWELKNINTCLWLIALGSDLEQHRFGLTQGQFLGRPADPELFGRKMRKRDAERIIYVSTIVAWLLLPMVAVMTTTPHR